MAPGENGNRTVDIETQQLPAKDLMLAMRLGDGQFEPDMPVSARIRADIGPDGMPQMVDGRILMEKGFIEDTEEPLSRIAIDRAEFSLDWDAMRRALIVPFQIISGGNRITLFAQLDAPRDAGGAWGLKVTGGTVVLAADAADPDPLILNRFLMRLRIDPDKQRIDVEQGELGNMDVGRRDLRQCRLRRRRAADGHRHRRQPHVGCGDEAAVAGHDRAQGARLGRGAHRQRDGGAGADRDQCAAVDLEAERPADAG